MVPLFKRLGLGSVLGYLAVGLAIGPFGIGWFSDPRSIPHVAELGVVMFLFIIGLEMQSSRLWKLRGEIFGLGVAQVLACGALLTVAGLSSPAAFMAAMGFVQSSTAIVMQILAERDETAIAQGQRIVILLLEDLAIVPLLALLAPVHIDPWHRHWLRAGYQVRETQESDLVFGEAALRVIGVSPDEAAEVVADVRKRDTDRFALEVGGCSPGVHSYTAT